MPCRWQVAHNIKFQDAVTTHVVQVMLRHWRTDSGELAIAIAYASDKRTGDVAAAGEGLDVSRLIDFKLYREIMQRSGVREISHPEL